MVQQHIAPSTRNMPPRGTLANHPLGDADVDSTDKGTVGVTCTGTVTGACRILDLDFDGDYDSTDATKFDSLTQGQARHPGKASTGVDQPFAHQGLLFEPELASYQNRARQYDPAKRRFLQRDPLIQVQFAGTGYQDGLNTYLNANANPLSNMDPTGRQCCPLPRPDCGPFYGNWCGPGWSGGLCPGCSGPPAPPIDPTDSCCEAHDGCYIPGGNNTACNTSMCTCLTAVGTLPSGVGTMKFLACNDLL